MDFFAAQAAARRRRRWLAAAFFAVVALVAVLPSLLYFLPLEWPMRAAIGGLFAGSMLIPAWQTYRWLKDAGDWVATRLDAEAVYPGTNDLPRQRLHNIIEEMALASGLSVPSVYLLSGDDSINAMAAGYRPDRASVLVTRGAVERLDREQLQALVAHEFSHIRNGDMATNTHMIAWMDGLNGVYGAGHALASPGEDSPSQGAWPHNAVGSLVGYLPAVLLGVVMMVAGGVGRFFASLLQAAACRQHERLADAEAAQFTRNPAALKQVLLAIAGEGERRGVRKGRVNDAVAHLWFAATGSRWLRTHPTLPERIRALDPGFRPQNFAAEAERAWQAGERRRLASLMPAQDARRAVEDKSALLETLPYLALAATPEFVVGKVGHPDGDDLARGAALRAALPEAVTRCAGSPGLARALTCAILASGDAARWSRQMTVLAQGLGEPVRAEVETLREIAASLDLYLRLPAIEAVVPRLRGLSPRERHALLETLTAMEREDGQTELFESCLNLMVRHGLDDERYGVSARRGSLWHAGGALQTLLSIVALHAEPDDPVARKAAYRAGVEVMGGGATPALAVPPNWSVALDASLDKLARLGPVDQRRIVAALTATVAHDGRLSLAEAELLRTLCAILRCPLPPLLPEVTAVPAAAPAVPPAT